MEEQQRLDPEQIDAARKEFSLPEVGGPVYPGQGTDVICPACYLTGKVVGLHALPPPPRPPALRFPGQPGFLLTVQHHVSRWLCPQCGRTFRD